MSWALGLSLACLWLVAIYLILEFMGFVKRNDRDMMEFTEHQWKDIRKQDFRRRMEDRARKERAGIR
jgi:predicted outer membrane lipoprotein